MLDELRPILGEAAVGQLAKRLNRPGKDRLAAMWEVAVMAPLARLGRLDHEDELPSGKRPDIFFDDGNGLTFIADVTVASDEGRHDDNPYEEFSRIIETEKRTLGLGVGGVNLSVLEAPERTARGVRRRLRLPPREELLHYVRTVIIPELKVQLDRGEWPLSMSVDDGVAGFSLKIAEGPYSYGHYGSYDQPTIVDHNPLFSALTKKARKLRAATGLTGIIVGDGDCSAMSYRIAGWGQVTAEKIVREFLDLFPSVGFVMLLTVKEEGGGWRGWMDRKRTVVGSIWTRPDVPASLPDLLGRVASAMPPPIDMPINAARRAREKGYGRGHGSFQMSRSGLKIGARHLMEVLSGRRTVEDLNRSFDFCSADEFNGTKRINPFEQALMEGRLPIRMTVLEPQEQDRDNVVEFEFGEPDPAVSKFR